MHARIGAVIFAGLAAVVLTAGCSVDKPDVETVIEKKGEISSGTIDRIRWDNEETPSRVYFSFVGDGITAYNCTISKVNGCIFLQPGDHIIVSYVPDEEVSYDDSTGPTDRVLDIEWNVPVGLPAEPPFITPPS